MLRPHLWSTMRNTASTDASKTKVVDHISINHRADIWRVTLNGNFYGDYSRKYWALEAAIKKADALVELGRAATITSNVDGRTDTPLYDTRRPSSRKDAKHMFESQLHRPLRWPRLLRKHSVQILTKSVTD